MQARGWNRWAWIAPFALVWAAAAAALPGSLVSSIADSPDPFLPGAMTTISVTLSDPAAVTIAIYDTSGKAVRMLCTHFMSKVWNLNIPWDGKDDAGRQVGAATYTYTVRADGVDGAQPASSAASGTVTIGGQS